MASRKKESEGIALLSMYYDEEEEDEEMVEAEPEPSSQEQQRQEEGEGEELEEPGSGDQNYEKDEDAIAEPERTVASDSGNENTPSVVRENFTPLDGKFGASTPQPVSPPPPQQQQQQKVGASDSGRSRRGRLTIVDYGHDEVAMSPEAEEGEIENGDRVMLDVVHQRANGDFHEKTPPGTVHILTPGAQATPQSTEHEPSQLDPMNYAANDSESGEAADLANVTEDEPKDVDPLDKFLPPTPRAKCSVELQERINKFLLYKKAGKSFNAEVRNRKDYRNPDFLLHAVRYQDIDQIGSCFSKDVFDPHGYDKSDYVEEIEADMKREMERKEQERKKNQKVEFVSGGNQPAPPKITMPIPAVPSSASHPMPTAPDAVARDGRQNKKSKWDKVDGDRRNPLPSGGQDSMAAVGTHAALLSAANAGSGYTAFAQQRRREAEEKRYSERRSERRS